MRFDDDLIERKCLHLIGNHVHWWQMFQSRVASHPRVIAFFLINQFPA
jgi:hypothetical protein